MDKFGIFNLLNSFLNLSSNTSSAQGENKDEQSSAPKDLLSGLFSGLKNNSSEPTTKTSPSNEQGARATPLQRQMLSTIATHDQIIKRVNNKKP